MSLARFLPLLLVALSAASAPAQGGTTPPSPAAQTVRSVRAAPAAGALRLDGRLDEPAWATAEAATGFTESYPTSGAPDRLGTEARILFDESALYVGMRMDDPVPDSIAGQLTRRDAGGYSDWAQVMIDSYHDRRTGFAFAVNPRGVKRDIFLYNDQSEDIGWDAVWEVAVSVDSAGWTAEFRIPFSQLRFAKGEPEGGRVWGLQLSRDVARRQSRMVWSPWTRDDNAFVGRFGDLTGLVGVRAPRRLEIQPYTSTRLTHTPERLGNPGRPEGRDDPFFREAEVGASAGADVKVGLPSGLTLTATLNPDFGQVEADPAVVNLSAFEIQLPENRPFFNEGSDIFRFGSLLSYISQGTPQFLYSRRVGRAPQRSLAGNSALSWTDVPAQTTILGAAKVSGRTAGGWSVGLLDALTSGEDARVQYADGRRADVGVEPLTNYLVGRARKDLNGGRTVLGGITTATHRALRDTVFSPLLRSNAWTAGLDGEHTTKDRLWSVSGYLAGSRVGGSEAAIAATQRSSARYFQRLDADHLSYDSTRTSLGGLAGGFALRRAGDWRGSLWYSAVSPGFETNDAGFLGRTDRHAMSALWGRRRNKPGPVFRDWFVRAFTSHAWNFGGDLLDANYALRGTGTFRSLWNATATVEHSASTLDDRLTRSGPLVRTPSSWAGTLYVGSDPRRRLVAGTEVYASEDEAGGHYRYADLSLTGRPATNVRVSVAPGVEWLRSTAQYVRTRADALAADTYGRRYVFADLEQTTLSVSTRLDWTFTPTLSLQLYARPYVSAGSYGGYKELTAPRSYSFAEYGRDRGTIELGSACGASQDPGLFTVDPDGAGAASCFQFARPDFNFRSLRGNAVLRWEYRPGSTFFLVWQQQREGAEEYGDFDTGRDLGGIFDAPARNVLLLKATYWIGR